MGFDMPLSLDQLKQFLEDELGVDVSDITEETLLFSTGVVDSFALVSLMTFIESEAGITISPSDVNLDNFDSMARILRYVGSVPV